MKMEDFNSYEQNQRMYGGTAGRKVGISFNGKNYILKFPGNLKEQGMKNIQLSYSNSPVCEYIGSQVYQILGFLAHETVLGERNGKTVVACEDFLRDGDKLYEFDKIKVTFEPHFLDSNGNETNGVGVDLYEILMTVQEHPFLKDVPDMRAHFWNMFVVDALIGNPDRNNSNWGIILRPDGSKRIAPVYDNGNCLNCKWDEQKMLEVLSDQKMLEAESYKGRRCIFELEGKKINPYHIMESMKYPECTEALKRLVPVMTNSLPKIDKMIWEIPVLSEVQKQFYTEIIKCRYDNLFLPLYQKIEEKLMNSER
ncbi:MAG: CtkA family protein [Lachnospiraceae bacterium]|nr:CtkA family protein [Lachnospiraceae bacterium]